LLCYSTYCDSDAAVRGELYKIPARVANGLQKDLAGRDDAALYFLQTSMEKSALLSLLRAGDTRIREWHVFCG
jgi:hypothetical protein